MNAGTLVYRLEFQELIKKQNETGEETKTYSKAFVCRAAKVKSDTSIKSGINAKELFDNMDLVFRVRNYPQIKDTHRVVYDGNTYRIKFFERMAEDNSIRLTLEKLNP